jgi:hypothetical protein
MHCHLRPKCHVEISGMSDPPSAKRAASAALLAPLFFFFTYVLLFIHSRSFGCAKTCLMRMQTGPQHQVQCTATQASSVQPLNATTDETLYHTVVISGKSNFNLYNSAKGAAEAALLAPLCDTPEMNTNVRSHPQPNPRAQCPNVGNLLSDG